MGRGHGRGGGWRHRHGSHATGLTGRQRAQMDGPGQGATFPTALSKEQELAALKRQIQSLEQMLGELESRTQEIDKPAPGASAKEHE
jgi:hypothetical protein